MKDYEKIELVFKICNRSWATRYRTCNAKKGDNKIQRRRTSLLTRFVLNFCGYDIHSALNLNENKVIAARSLVLTHEEVLMENTIFNKIFGS